MDTFLFDLDGTMLPMDQDKFVKIYFNALTVKFAQLGYDSENTMKAFIKSLDKMIINDGSSTNEEVFWKSFSELMGDDVLSAKDEFISFYQNEFKSAKSATWVSEYAPQDIKILKQKGYQVVAATNPLFPQVATYTRMKWAGLNIDDFLHITTYENSKYCKPNTEYYREIMNKIGKEPQDCIMVGNDINEDIAAGQKAGIGTFLIEDCLINSNGLHVSADHCGSYKDFHEFVLQLEPAAVK